MTHRELTGCHHSPAHPTPCPGPFQPITSSTLSPLQKRCGNQGPHLKPQTTRQEVTNYFCSWFSNNVAFFLLVFKKISNFSCTDIGCYCTSCMKSHDRLYEKGTKEIIQAAAVAVELLMCLQMAELQSPERTFTVSGDRAEQFCSALIMHFFNVPHSKY